MNSSCHPEAILESPAGQERAKQWRYVICQSAGWLFFMFLQLALSQFVVPHKPDSFDERLEEISLIVMVFLIGWLLSDVARLLIVRWGWRELGWRALLPRILALSAGLSLVWIAIGYGYPYAVLGLPWTAKISLPLMIVLAWFNAALVFAGWLCIYFFRHLFDRFNRSEIERLHLATSVKEAELRALKSQVNPHFIFNSLNSLRALIDEDPPRARQAVTQLANLLRYSLQSGQLETVPFEDELRVVNDYLALEQVRHEERLRLRFDISPETLALPVPPMLLQTLVENAVKYGIATRPEGGEIAIIARRENGVLKLQVTNPGALPDAAGAAVSPARGAPPASTGVGLKNAANRLRLLFGERASLQLRALAPGRVVAEANIPLPLTQT